MYQHNVTWVSLYNKLSVKKNLSRLERGIQILTRSYYHLADRHQKLLASHDLLLESGKSKDKALKCLEEKIFHLTDRYVALENTKCTLESEMTAVTEEKDRLCQEIDALNDTILELKSLVTPFSSDGTSVEDYPNSGW
jgi:chromosome segregation ATPase